MFSGRRVAVAAVCTLAVAGVVAAGVEPAGAAGTWRVRTVVTASGDVVGGYLDSVAAVSATSAWATGTVQLSTSASTAGVVAHWTDGSWHRVTPPLLTTGSQPTLYRVRATRAAGVWVTGVAEFADGAHAFVSRLSGSHWMNHRLALHSTAADVRIFGADDVWVLYARGVGAEAVGFGEHWDGRTWTTTRLQAVPAYGVGSGHWAEANAPGTTTAELLHLAGGRWTVVAGPHVTHSPATAGYAALLVRGSSLFAAVGYTFGGVEGRTGPGVTLYERDAHGGWHQRLSLPKEYAAGLTRTSTSGLWLLSSSGRTNRLLHVLHGRVVSSHSAPEVSGHPTVLRAVSGTAHSATVFTAAGTKETDSYGPAAATYRP